MLVLYVKNFRLWFVAKSFLFICSDRVQSYLETHFLTLLVCALLQERLCILQDAFAKPHSSRRIAFKFG